MPKLPRVTKPEKFRSTVEDALTSTNKRLDNIESTEATTNDRLKNIEVALKSLVENNKKKEKTR